MGTDERDSSVNYCPNGHPVKKQSNFCTVCGSPVEQATSQAPLPVPPVEHPEDAPHNRGLTKSQLLVGGTALVILALLAALIISLTSKTTPSATRVLAASPRKASSTTVAPSSTEPPSTTAVPATTTTPTPATTPASGSSSPTESTVPSGGLWTSSQLTISPQSLGTVQLGMTLNQAEGAAGLNFDGMGDGMFYPTSLPDELYVGLGNDSNVRCVGAAEGQAAGLAPTVSTPEGFHLGDSVQTLLNIYGSRAQYLPAPTTGGIDPVAGYIVAETGGNLFFYVDPTTATVPKIAGGPNVSDSNSCSG